MSDVTLYGSPLSLYSGRVRSYLIKAGIDYRETVHTSAHYNDVVLPKAGGRRGIPTVELAGGEVIRDGAAIIDHFEAASGHGFSPQTPKQKIVSLLFDVIGAEGLLRPAMHYRWNFPEQNHAFLQFHFRTMAPPGSQNAEMAEKGMQAMRNAAQAFGAVPETFETIEGLYNDLLEKLDAHFSDQPYLLGGRPSIGDFGLIAPMYGHLGRDPAPLALLQSKAIRAFRWVERMNRPELDIGEFEDQSGAWLEDDVVPETLIAVLKCLAEDFVPETKAAAACINDWINTQEGLQPGTLVERGVGLGSFKVRGQDINALAQPYRFYQLKRVQDAHAAMNAEEKVDVEAMLAASDMSDVLDVKLTRDIGTKDNREIWL